MNRTVTALFVLAAIALSSSGVAAGVATTSGLLPGPALPNGFGVNVHFRGQPQDLDMIAEAGFKLIRMDLTWAMIEQDKGIYEFEKLGYDSLTEGCAKRGIRILYILNYGNTLYEKARSVRTQAGREAFAHFAEAAAERYAGKGILWEIWNEPNIEHFWDPQPSAEDYCKLVEITARRIKRADPNALVVAGATSQIPFEWLEDCFKRGLLEWIDVLSVHPYRSEPPETVVADYTELRRLVARYLPRGKQMPIISGEWGYSNLNWDRTRLSEQKQAEYLARMFLTNLHQGVDISIWYDWKNDGTDLNEREHQFGTVRYDGNPKAAYLAAKVLASTLAGYKLDARIDLGNENDFVFKLTKNGREAIAFWTTAEKHTVTLPIEPTEVTLVGIYGGKVVINWKTKHLKLSALQSPQYLLIEPKQE
ncbi:MAG: cellulase family glycosylhydrolase [Planctomycetota bacterium]|jgi:hypothetical protein